MEALKDDIRIWHSEHHEMAGVLQNLFQHISRSTSNLKNLDFSESTPSLILEEDNLSIFKISWEDEIKQTLFSTKAWSAPESDGFQT